MTNEAVDGTNEAVDGTNEVVNRTNIIGETPRNKAWIGLPPLTIIPYVRASDGGTHERVLRNTNTR
jgi:hypothetical protein